MTAELVIAAGFVGIVVLMLIGGAVMLFRGGRKGVELDEAKEDAREATDQVQRRTEPVPTDRSYYERLRRLSERLAKLRDRAAK